MTVRVVMTAGVVMTITGELVSHFLFNGNKRLQPLAFFLDDELKIITMRKNEVYKF